MSINITLIIAIFLIILMGIKGYRRGMTKEISGCISLAVTLFVVTLIIMLFGSVIKSQTRNVVYTILILLAIALIYSIVKIILKSAKLLSKLPVLHFLDRMLGFTIGMGEGILVIWIFDVILRAGLLGSLAEFIYRDIAASSMLSNIIRLNYLAKLAELL